MFTGLYNFGRTLVESGWETASNQVTRVMWGDPPPPRRSVPEVAQRVEHVWAGENVHDGIYAPPSSPLPPLKWVNGHNQSGRLSTIVRSFFDYVASSLDNAPLFNLITTYGWALFYNGLSRVIDGRGADPVVIQDEMVQPLSPPPYIPPVPSVQFVHDWIDPILERLFRASIFTDAGGAYRQGVEPLRDLVRDMVIDSSAAATQLLNEEPLKSLMADPGFRHEVFALRDDLVTKLAQRLTPARLKELKQLLLGTLFHDLENLATVIPQVKQAHPGLGAEETEQRILAQFQISPAIEQGVAAHYSVRFHQVFLSLRLRSEAIALEPGHELELTAFSVAGKMTQSILMPIIDYYLSEDFLWPLFASIPNTLSDVVTGLWGDSSSPPSSPSPQPLDLAPSPVRPPPQRCAFITQDETDAMGRALRAVARHVMRAPVTGAVLNQSRNILTGIVNSLLSSYLQETPDGYVPACQTLFDLMNTPSAPGAATTQSPDGVSPTGPSDADIDDIRWYYFNPQRAPNWVISLEPFGLWNLLCFFVQTWDQYPLVIKNLVYRRLDSVLEGLFPELDDLVTLNGLRQRLGTSTRDVQQTQSDLRELVDNRLDTVHVCKFELVAPGAWSNFKDRLAAGDADFLGEMGRAHFTTPTLLVYHGIEWCLIEQIAQNKGKSHEEVEQAFGGVSIWDYLYTHRARGYAANFAALSATIE